MTVRPLSRTNFSYRISTAVSAHKCAPANARAIAEPTILCRIISSMDWMFGARHSGTFYRMATGQSDTAVPLYRSPFACRRHDAVRVHPGLVVFRAGHLLQVDRKYSRARSHHQDLFPSVNDDEVLVVPARVRGGARAIRGNRVAARD